MFPRDIICLRNISINTLHKGDDGDDDDDDDDVYHNNNNIININSLDESLTIKADTIITTKAYSAMSFTAAIW